MALELEESDSPFMRMIGVRVLEWRDGFVRLRADVAPHLLNRSGVLHGCALASLLDNAAGMSGMWCGVPGNKRYGMTLSLTTNFVGQTREGAVFATGHRADGGGKRIFFADSEVRTEAGALLAKAAGVFRYRTGSERVEGVPARA